MNKGYCFRASLAILIFFTGCSNKEILDKKAIVTQQKVLNKITNYPQWYKTQNIIPKKSYEAIGYGHGKTIKEAKSNAKENIALEIVSHVESKYESISTDKYRHSKSELKVSTQLDLQALRIVRKEYKNNHYFIALMYENLDLSQKIKKTLKLTKCTNENVNSYMSQTILHKKITSALECQLDMKIDRKNNAWYLKYKEHLFLLNEDEFEELFITTKSKYISLNPSRTRLREGDRYHFNIATQDKSYVTIFNVYQNGIVTILTNSHKINKNLRLPKMNATIGFESGLFENNPNTLDLYIAVKSKQPLDVSRFEEVSYGFENKSNKMAFKFDELIEFIDAYEYSSVLIRTKVKH